MSNYLPKGTITAIVTPFKSDLSIDFDAFERLMNFQIENRVDGIVVCGSTGESATLSQDEKISLISKAKEISNGKVPIIAGTGTNDTKKTIEFSLIIKEIGVDALLLVAPYYNKPTQQGLVAHFSAINDAVEIPQIIYNVPGRTGINMSSSTQVTLAKNCKNIIATKEASGDIDQIMQVIKDAPDDFIVLSGDDAITLPLIAAGAKGIVSVFSNFAPSQLVEIVNSALAGDYDNARKLHYKYLNMMDLCFVESNPVPAKAALQLMGIIDDYVRMPLLKITDKNLEVLKQEMIKLKII